MSRPFLLPSGKLATEFFHGGEMYYQLSTRSSEDWVTLDAADIEALYAQSIAHDGGREMRPEALAIALCGCNRSGCCLQCECGESHR